MLITLLSNVLSCPLCHVLYLDIGHLPAGSGVGTHPEISGRGTQACPVSGLYV